MTFGFKFCDCTRRVQLEHENIVQVFGSVLLDPDAMKIGLLFEQCANQPVTDELFEAERKLKIERASQLALDVSHAICYLHDNDIVLRGFSSDNVKVDSFPFFLLNN